MWSNRILIPPLLSLYNLLRRGKEIRKVIFKLELSQITQCSLGMADFKADSFHGAISGALWDPQSRDVSLVVPLIWMSESLSWFVEQLFHSPQEYSLPASIAEAPQWEIIEKTFDNPYWLFHAGCPHLAWGALICPEILCQCRIVVIQQQLPLPQKSLTSLTFFLQIFSRKNPHRSHDVPLTRVED